MKNIFYVVLITANLAYAMDQEESCGALQEQYDKERASKYLSDDNDSPSIIYSGTGVTLKGTVITGAIIKTSEGLVCSAHEQTSPTTPVTPILSYSRALEVVEFLAGQEYINALHRKALDSNPKKQLPSSPAKFSNNKPVLIDIESIKQLPKIYTCMATDDNGAVIAQGHVLQQDNDLVFIIRPRQYWQKLSKCMGKDAAKRIILCEAGREYISMLTSDVESPIES